MQRKPEDKMKPKVVAFKVEAELAAFLNKLPNKSAFIRKAIAAQLGIACPLCNGKGVVPRGVHDHYAPLIRNTPSRSCDGCGHDQPLPLDPGELTTETASGWSSSSTAARSTATAVTKRPPPATTAAGTSPTTASPNTSARPTPIEPHRPPPPPGRPRAAAAAPDLDALRRSTA